MKFINLTPHAITLVREHCNKLEIDPEATPARVQQVPGHSLGKLNGVDIFTSTTFCGVEGLPGPQDGVIYIVSSLVAQALARTNRKDVFSPGTGPTDGAVRNDKGQVIGVTRLVQAPQG